MIGVVLIALFGGAAAIFLANNPDYTAVATPTITPAPPPTSPPPTPASATGSPTEAASRTPRPTRSPSPSPSPSPPPNLLGADGRFTVLLLGSDHRTTGGGYRTDTMIVVSTVPETKEVSAVSVPRDVAQFPLPEGGVYGPKVNGLYSTYLERVGGEGHAGAGPLMKVTFANALGIEIDYYVFIGFGGVVELIDAVGGVEVTLEETYSDPSYQVSPSEIGVTFPAGVNQLDGERALIFARSRKGDNDFERARRQQLLVAAAVKAVAERGLDQLPELIEMAKPHISTDLPIEAYDLLFEVVGSSDVDEARREVLGPPTYAVPAGGTDYALQLEVVRDLAQELFGPVDGAE